MQSTPNNPNWPSAPPLKEDQIDKKTLEISRANDNIYNNMQDLSDELPDNSPRFVLLSYPLTLGSGRLSVPYVMLNYLPDTCNQETRMLYAGAKELMRNQAEAGRIIEIDAAEEVETIEEKLQGEDWGRRWDGWEGIWSVERWRELDVKSR
jgi:hypothetical protein